MSNKLKIHCIFRTDFINENNILLNFICNYVLFLKHGKHVGADIHLEITDI